MSPAPNLTQLAPQSQAANSAFLRPKPTVQRGHQGHQVFSKMPLMQAAAQETEIWGARRRGVGRATDFSWKTMGSTFQVPVQCP